jgi:hypothetical protein
MASGECQSPSGAFYAWVDAETGEPAFEYPEITGYALTHFSAGDDPAEKDAGARAADWLLERLGSGGDMSARAGWDNEAIYNFDLGMISTGLLAFGRLHGEARWIERGEALARDIAAQIEPDGRLRSIAGENATTDRSAWSTEGGAHVIKLAQCVLAAGDRDAAARLIATAAAIQRPDGRFVTHPSDNETMLHPHLYATEGLWCFAEATGDADAHDRARHGAEWAFAHQLGSGGLPRYVATASGDPGPEQFDLTAQAVRMALLTGLRDDRVERAAARLSDCAVGEDGKLALPYQPELKPNHRNAWVTMFGAQALSLMAPNAPKLRWELLV